MKNKGLLISIGILFILLGLLLFKNQTNLKKSQAVTAHASQELSSDEYKKVRAELIDILLKQNPRVALTTLREQAKSNPAVARSCHDLVHEIGHEAYKRYGDFGQAMQYQNEMCNAGYLHGIIESHFANADDIFKTMQTVCQNYNPRRFIGWECLHGVGHGLMYFTENDLSKSLTLCESYSNNDARAACVNGVFMENFTVDQNVHSSQFVKISDPLYPCAEQKTEYKIDCYLYAPTFFLTFHKNAYEDALQLCRTAEKAFRFTCITGVGSQAIRENISNPKFVESLCMQGSTDETNSCIAGMVRLYINHFGGLKEATQLCPTLEKRNQQTCWETITTREFLF